MVRGFRTEVLPLSVLFPVTVPSRNKVRTDTAGLRCPRSLPLRVFEVSLDFVTVRDLILFLTARGDQLTIDTLHQVVKCHPNLRDSVVEAVVVPQLECVNKSQPSSKNYAILILGGFPSELPVFDYLITTVLPRSTVKLDCSITAQLKHLALSSLPMFMQVLLLNLDGTM